MWRKFKNERSPASQVLLMSGEQEGQKAYEGGVKLLVEYWAIEEG